CRVHQLAGQESPAFRHGRNGLDEFLHTWYTACMKLTMMLKLQPTPEQADALLDTMHAFNAAANYAAERAFLEKTANSFALQKLVYAEIRLQYGLSAQLALLAIHKATGAYKRDKNVRPMFRSEGAITYDSRVMAFKGLTEVSLLTLQGRIRIPFRVGAYQQARMGAIKGQADLIYRTGRWYLAVTLDMLEPPPGDRGDVLGVDLGIANLATDNDGETFSGEPVDRVRQKMTAIKSALQKRDTKSAKRHLKKISGRESRFRRDTNHCISKHLVSKARRTHRGIALEDLRHNRSRTEGTVRKSQRQRHSSWAFAQLRAFITYKAQL